MKTILVPTDFSETATNALQYAAAIASQVKGKLIIATIINLPVAPVLSEVINPSLVSLEEDYNKELSRLAENLREKCNHQFEVETICQYGFLLADLNEIVKAEAVDLVVMGTKGATNLLDKLVGTNTSEYIKMATCPVLVIPSGATYTGIKNIAYASDFESEEKIVLQQLFGIAEPFQAQVAIVNVQTNYQLDIVPDKEIIQDIKKNFPDKNFRFAQVQKSKVVAGLYEFIQENPVEVLAVAIQQQGVVEDLFHSSISKQLVQQTKLPLLTLPTKPYRKSGIRSIAQKQPAIKVN
ncbi:universal stress protein [Adhaeribacter radiodurans]|uniref:Universal stress protein n=1 Tax=Adhaeribacter radiodurans TaxID=2745197 RepID=A0A7L7L1J7_9BACT|nr:universal stress protein [Adhaeribacter radiodurans]QMU26663.1 universal stress protein [Adhaeribacter radiodurans]